MSAKTTTEIDFVKNIVVDSNSCTNELRSLTTLAHGLRELCASVKRREIAFERAGGDKVSVMVFGARSDEERYALDIMACRFHWFGLSLCNYVRLVGFIHGIQRGQFTREELTDKEGARKAKESIEVYMDGVSEIAPVRIWRNKVFAHFAITDPYKDDNVSTLDMSVVFPVSFEGRYVVGGLTMTHRNSSGTHTSALPRWSMTEVFEAIIPRYWPGLRFQSGDEPSGTTDRKSEPTS